MEEKGYQDRVCVLVSGGVDSCVLLAELATQYRQVFPLYIQAGLVWEEVELYWLREFTAALKNGCVQELTVLSLPMTDLYGAHWSVTGEGVPGYTSALHENYLPGRNLILLAKAAVFCALYEIQVVALAPLKENPFPDTTEAFFRACETVVGEGLRLSWQVLTPFRHLHKAAVVWRGRRLPLELTFSCAQPVGKRHCGRCTKCAERQQGFREAGVPDLTTYVAVESSGGRAQSRKE
jgi:7-cyano-7-deazaguanine synthase